MTDPSLLFVRKSILVWDFDGTLADLTVDWNEVKRELFALAEDLEVEGPWLNATVEALRRAGRIRDAFSVIERHERQGTLTAIPISLDFLKWSAERYRQAIFSDNLRSTIHSALERFELTHAFEHIVAKDDVEHFKPAPDGLRAIQQHMDEDDLSRFLMIGNSAKDEQAAGAFGIDFLHVRDLGRLRLHR